MKEKPIIFNSEMVKAILEGRKTQTRRVIKPQPTNLPEGAYCDPYNKNYEHFTFWTKGNKMILSSGGNIKNTAHWKCLYGKPGDRLWVRETWAQVYKSEKCKQDVDDFYGDQKCPCGGCNLEYKSDSGSKYPGDWEEEEAKGNDEAPKWKPSIHMPRWASRITLEITDIRVERLFKISEEDAQKEGFKLLQGGIISEFAIFWDLIAKDKYKWQDNPWVWVIEFKKI